MIFDGKLATDPQYKGKRTGYRFMGWTLNDQPFTFNVKENLMLSFNRIRVDSAFL
jgi:hypothetical protein